MNIEEIAKQAECKYFKGERSNPFDWNTQNAANQFWEYEKTFCHEYLLGVHSCMTPKDALGLYLGKLFMYLADKYDSMDRGESFREKYYETDGFVNRRH